MLAAPGFRRGDGHSVLARAFWAIGFRWWAVGWTAEGAADYTSGVAP
jgi:hypothetical protein